MSPRRLAILGACGALVAAPARAGNQETVLLGNEAAMTGGAVVALVDDGGAAWYNPAGLARIERTSVDLSASAFILRVYDLPNAARTRLAGGTRPEDASFLEVVSVPSALTFVRRLSTDVTGALGVFVPDHEDLVATARYESPTYRWNIAVSRRTTDYYAGPSIGVRLAPSLRLGLGALGSYHSLRTSRAFASDFEPAASEGVTRAVLARERRVASRSIGGRLTLGLQYDATERLSLGLALRGPEAIFARFDEGDEGGAATVLVAGAPPVVDAEAGTRGGDGSTFQIVRPPRATVGLAYRVGPAAIDLEGDLEPGLVNVERGIDRQPVWNARVGAKLPVSERVSIGAGLFTDRSPQRTPTALGATRIDFYGASAGLQIASAHARRDRPDDAGLLLSTTVAVRYARGEGAIGGLLFDPLAPPVDVVADVTIHELSLHLGTALDF